MKKVGIVGGRGYTRVGSLRILATHPDAELAAIIPSKDRAIPSIGMFPHPHRRVNPGFSDPAAGGLERCAVVFFSVIDRLLKGAAGQAVQVQNASPTFGVPETMGIEHIPPLP